MEFRSSLKTVVHLDVSWAVRIRPTEGGEEDRCSVLHAHGRGGIVLAHAMKLCLLNALRWTDYFHRLAYYSWIGRGCAS
jgi:hypothetical protein